MVYKLKAYSIKIAIKHLCRYGDTDVFPHLPEISFLKECENEIIKEIKDLDLDSYVPGNSIEALGPKSRYGFRIVHQLSYLDSLLLLSTVIEIGDKIESYRPSSDKFNAFSYRFLPDEKGRIFREDRTYKEWLDNQLSFLRRNLKIKKIVSTDISDFYARINFHRLENLLDEIAPKNGAAKYIKNNIKVIRAKQSFGLPVGGAAARLLAELALSDTDNALENDGRIVTRFVDDFRIFLTAAENPYDALALLAEQLGINEGLSLNVAKTEIFTRNEYVRKLKSQRRDISDQAKGSAIETLTAGLYFDNTPDPDDLEKLKSMNLLGFLQDEVEKDNYDMGKVKVIFRALKIAKPPEAIDYLTRNFTELVVFSKELTLLMQQLDNEDYECFYEMTKIVKSSILSPPASSIQLIRTWILELFVRGIVEITHADIKSLETLNTTLDKRQINLIRGRIGDKNYFRRQKTAFGQIGPMEQVCLIWGASCLPRDEYETWLHSLKPLFTMPTGGLFLKWAKTEKEKMIKKLEYSPDEHQE